MSPADPLAEDSLKKKSKKQRNGSDGNLQGRVKVHQEAVLASVGDQELAKSGKPIQKKMYSEHAEVAALSEEEVEKHRTDRDTAVTGVDLRPVLQFHQAGECFETNCKRSACLDPDLDLVLNCRCICI